MTSENETTETATEKEKEETPAAEATEKEPQEADEEEGEPGFWQQQRKLSYPLVASVALPPLFLATCFLLYRDFDRLAHEPVPDGAGSSTPGGGGGGGARSPLSPSSSSSIAARPPTTPPPTQSIAPAPPAPTASVFDHIYKSGFWATNDAGVGTSGTGSTLVATALYRTYLQAFLKDNKIKSVVDGGCGDWEFSKAIDWTGIDYKGYDVVESVIAKNKQKYEAANIHFFTGNIVTDDLPQADLFISKHVFQHLPNEDMVKFANLQMGKFKHTLLTDSVHPFNFSSDNRDIKVGGFRFFDPTAAPFNFPGMKELTWWDGKHMHQVVHLIRADKRDKQDQPGAKP